MKAKPTHNFVIGQVVHTIKGDKMRGPGYGGKIVGFSKWKNYDAANVKKEDGTVRQFLCKNLRLRIV